ncbi:uncharacterized protein LOC129058032 [Pongo abelii]|uniref:uncharacterized protein LOC129058032 n=1 Tax=Pongo abelii TaxID=9601 RepID=UPI0023E8E146|nr:uncharacterized protein LOC129058032 [Pongo abelii]
MPLGQAQFRKFTHLILPREELQSSLEGRGWKTGEPPLARPPLAEGAGRVTLLSQGFGLSSCEVGDRGIFQGSWGRARSPLRLGGVWTRSPSPGAAGPRRGEVRGGSARVCGFPEGGGNEPVLWTPARQTAPAPRPLQPAAATLLPPLPARHLRPAPSCSGSGARCRAAPARLTPPVSAKKTKRPRPPDTRMQQYHPRGSAAHADTGRRAGRRGSRGSHAHHTNASAHALAFGAGALSRSGFTAGRRKC